MAGLDMVTDGATTDEGTDLLARRIVVAIPALNEAGNIGPCIESLLTGEASLAEILVIVADGGSTDTTRAQVDALCESHSNVRLIDNPDRIQAVAVNLVAARAGKSRDILIRCDAHSVYPANFLLDVARSLLRNGADSLVIPMDAVGQTPFERANAWIVDTPLGSGGSAHRGGRKSGPVDHGHHAGFLRQRFIELGGYDPTFTHNEDAEYDARLAAAGGRIWLDADIRIGYRPRGTVRSLWLQYFGYGKGRARNVLKNRLRPRLRQLIPVVNLILLALSVMVLPTLGMWALGWPLLYAAILTLSSIGVMLWKRSWHGLYAGVALATMHLAWASGFIAGAFSHFRHDRGRRQPPRRKSATGVQA